jgi:hypothetical protein
MQAIARNPFLWELAEVLILVAIVMTALGLVANNNRIQTSGSDLGHRRAGHILYFGPARSDPTDH